MHLFTEEATITSLSTIITNASRSTKCAKCGTIKKSRRHSCCARDGAWFKKCGDVGDKKFDHTWAEGIEACKSLETSDSAKSPPQVMLRHTEAIIYALDSAQTRNSTRQQTNICCAGSVSNTGTTHPADCVGFTNLIICICIWFITSHLQA